MTLAATLLLSVSFALAPESALRIYNPHETAVDATLDCAGARHAVRVEAKDTLDFASCGTASLDAPLPLTLFETANEDGVETQRVLDANASCESFAIQAPLFGCRLGTATVAVPLVPGAVYAWSVDGASVVSGHGTNRLTLTLGGGTSALVTATVTGSCASTAQAVIGLREPLVIEKLEVPAAATTTAAATIRWSYAAGAAPVSQLLTGDAFETPIALGAGVRSYEWTPRTPGARTVELRASYAPAMSTRPRRRRAVGPSRASASDCPAARMSKGIEIGGCGSLNVSIDAPDTVEAGSTFTATIFLRTGETVRWSVTGGTILSGATADTVSVKAGELPGEVGLSAAVTAASSCRETAEARIPIVDRAVCATTAPVVSLALDRVSCDSATVRATFTGTPPFSGTWSDGAAFQTSNPTLTHEFRNPTTYTIRNFRDAVCSGKVASTVHVPSFGPTASVAIVGDSCLPGAKAVARFTGTPPFTGKWFGGEWFTTNATTIENTNLTSAVVKIEGFHDADCPAANRDSNRITLTRRATAHLRETSLCTSGGAYMLVDVLQPETTDRPPFTIYWSDGEVTRGGAQEWSIWRGVVPTQPLSEYTITRVTGAECDVLIDPHRDTAVVSYRPAPHIDRFSEIVSCLGTTSKIRLDPGYPADATLEWSVSRGEIVSGQGTPEVTILQKQLPAAEVTVTTKFADGRCSSSDKVQTILERPPAIVDFSVTPATIAPRGTAKVRFITNNQISNAWIEVIPSSRQSDLDFTNGNCSYPGDRIDCTHTFRDTHGAGTVGFVLHVGNHCGNTDSHTIQLQVQ